MLGRQGWPPPRDARCRRDRARRSRRRPGAPGDTATWAPADKHGFGTSHSAGEQRVVHAAAGVGERDLLPGPRARPPSAGCSSRSATAATVHARDGRRRPAPHRARRGGRHRAAWRRSPGSLAFEQVTETHAGASPRRGSRIPARPTVLADVRSSRSRAPLQLYVLADPAPGDDGNDDRGRRAGRLGRRRGERASRPTPRLRRDVGGYRGTSSDPWSDAARRRWKLAGYDAATPGQRGPGRAHAARRRRGRQAMTLGVGFGADARAPRAARARARSHAGFTAAQALRRGLARRYLARSKTPPATVAGRSGAERALRPVADRARGVRGQAQSAARRSRRRTCPGSGARSPRSRTSRTSGPYHLVWPRDFYHVATAQKAAGDDAAATRLLDYLWQVQKRRRLVLAEHARRRDGVLDEPAARRDLAPDRARLVARRRVAGDWEHIRDAADYVAAEGPGHRAGALGEPERLVAEHDRDGDRRPDLRGGHRAGQRRRRAAASYAAARRHVAAAGRVLDGDHERPYSDEPYYLRDHQAGARPGADGATTGSATTSRGRWTNGRSSTTRSSGSTLFGVKKWDDPVISELARRRRPVAGAADRRLPPVHVRRLRRDARGRRLGHIPDRREPDARPLLAAADRRARRVRAAPGRSAADAACGTIASSANDGLMLPEQVWTGPGGAAQTPARRRRWPGRTPSSSVSRGRSTAGAPDRAPGHRRLPASPGRDCCDGPGIEI